MSAEPKQWKIRAPNEEDLNFIYSTWIQSFWSGSEKYRHVSPNEYFKTYSDVIDRLLFVSQISVACKLDEDLVVYGYLVSQPPIAHYCFVKAEFRRFGIMKDLLEDKKCGEIYTHLTRDLSPILKSHLNEKHIYNPYLLYSKETENA